MQKGIIGLESLTNRSSSTVTKTSGKKPHSNNNNDNNNNDNNHNDNNNNHNYNYSKLSSRTDTHVLRIVVTYQHSVRASDIVRTIEIAKSPVFKVA